MKTKILYLIVLVTLLLSACSGGTAAKTQAVDSSAAQSAEPTAVVATAVTQDPTSSAGNGQGNGNNGAPPAEAIAACSGKAENDACSFTDQNGDHTGTCKSGSGQLACAPDQGSGNGGQGGQGGVPAPSGTAKDQLEGGGPTRPAGNFH